MDLLHDLVFTNAHVRVSDCCQVSDCDFTQTAAGLNIKYSAFRGGYVKDIHCECPDYVALNDSVLLLSSLLSWHSAVWLCVQRSERDAVGIESAGFALLRMSC